MCPTHHHTEGLAWELSHFRVLITQALCSSINPDEAVAYGAAVQASGSAHACKALAFKANACI
eukprot:2408859-Pleurochrysis_carterae.AAC.1